MADWDLIQLDWCRTQRGACTYSYPPEDQGAVVLVHS